MVDLCDSLLLINEILGKVPQYYSPWDYSFHATRVSSRPPILHSPIHGEVYLVYYVEY